MKPKHPRRIAPIVTALLLLFCALLFLSACGKKSTAEKLASLSPEKRAERLLALSNENFNKAASYRIDTALDMSLDADGAAISVEVNQTETVTGIGTEGFAAHRESTVVQTAASTRTSCTEKSGYRSGTMYFSSDGSGTLVKLRSEIPLADYLAFDAERKTFDREEALPLAIFDTAYCRTAASTVEADGSYTVTLSDFKSEAMDELRTLAKPLSQATGDGSIRLTGARATLTVSRELMPATAEIELFFDQSGEKPITLSARMIWSQIGSALPPDTSEVNGYTELFDLRLLYRIENALARLPDAESGAYRLELSENILCNGESIAHTETELGSYKRESGRLSFELTANDGTYLRLRSYANGKYRGRILSLETEQVEAEQTRDSTDAEMNAYLRNRMDRTGFSPSLISEVDSSRAAEGIYTLLFAAPDLSAYRDLLANESGVLSDACLTVTMRDGKLTKAVYELHAVKGSGIRIDLTHSVEYLEQLP